MLLLWKDAPQLRESARSLLVFDMIQHLGTRFLIVHIHRPKVYENYILHRFKKLKVELDKIRLSMSNVYSKYLNVWDKMTWKSLKSYWQYWPCNILKFDPSCGSLFLYPFLFLPIYVLVPMLQSYILSLSLCYRTSGSLAPRVSCFTSWLMWWCGRGLGWYSERPFKALFMVELLHLCSRRNGGQTDWIQKSREEMVR